MDKKDRAQGVDREMAWTSDLTPDQRCQLEQWLETHPDQRGVWEEELALTRVLTRLPDAAPPSNLTARVMAEIDRDATTSPDAAETTWLGWLRKLGWVPRLAGVALLVVVGAVGHHRYQDLKRNEMARNVAEVTEMASVVPSVEVLQDFTAIRNLEYRAVPDEDLLALLE